MLTVFWTPLIVLARSGLRSRDSSVLLTISTILSNFTANWTWALTPILNKKQIFILDFSFFLPRIFNWTVEILTETPAVRLTSDATRALRFKRAWILSTTNSMDDTETLASSHTSGGLLVLNGSGCVQIDALPVQLSVELSW